MPYIDVLSRERLQETITPKTAGELNFLITSFCTTYMNNLDYSYQSINDVLGALEGAKQEFYRRVAVPYEDKKRKQNGDVY